MKKILTAIGKPMLNKQIKNIKNCNLLAEDIENDEDLIEWLEKEEVDVLFLCSNIIKNYNPSELIRIIKKIQEDILILFFTGEKRELNLKEDSYLKIYSNLDIDLKVIENLLNQKSEKENISNKATIIAISGANGVREKYVFHIFCKKCGKRKVKGIINRF